MARQQYRLSGEFDWQSNSGNALLAIVNKLGSGKKLTIRSCEITPLTSSTTATIGTVSAAAASQLTVAKATVSGGENINPVALDTSASPWPSTVQLLKNASITSPSTLRRIANLKQLNQASLSRFGSQSIKKYCTAFQMPKNHPNNERIIIRAGEGFAFYCSTLNNSVPLRVSFTVVRHGTPNRTFCSSFFCNVLASGQAIFAINNTIDSGETVSVTEISIEEVGTFDSPYFQLVPISSLIESSSSRELSLLKMDTSYSDPSTSIEARADVPFFPFGLPENAFADASTGSPKGFNYLKTKDFLGPVWRSVFPEGVLHFAANKPDQSFIFSHNNSDLFIKRSGGIILREGEGFAIVSAAETAAGATSAVGVSGWSSFSIGITIDVEAAKVPQISLSGMIENSRWRIERVSDNSLVATGVVGPSGSASYLYETEDTPLNLRLKVRKATAAPFYKPYEVEFTLTSDGISIPISQISDS